MGRTGLDVRPRGLSPTPLLGEQLLAETMLLSESRASARCRRSSVGDSAPWGTTGPSLDQRLRSDTRAAEQHGNELGE